MIEHRHSHPNYTLMTRVALLEECVDTLIDAVNRLLEVHLEPEEKPERELTDNFEKRFEEQPNIIYTNTQGYKQ